MAITNLTNLTNANNVFEMTGAINNYTGGALAIVILFIVGLMTFISLLRTGSPLAAFRVTTLIISILTFIFWRIQFFADQVMWVVVIISGLALLASIVVKEG